ncbi:RNA-binding KH domain-containing protein PEPPER-like isoform X3 [Henckelia pumila]|uniref:RNA-binding KH domain-containing protein PEPPER-like isoform X3 n=1 Tax=Henckelia pumila TaxID=405737 RepID=UPI003C6E1532
MERIWKKNLASWSLGIRLSVYGADHGLGSRPSAIGHSGGPIVTQVTQTMQVPLAYAEDIIGVQGEILITLDALVVTF